MTPVRVSRIYRISNDQLPEKTCRVVDGPLFLAPTLPIEGPLFLDPTLPAEGSLFLVPTLPVKRPLFLVPTRPAEWLNQPTHDLCNKFNPTHSIAQKTLKLGKTSKIKTH